MSLDLKSILVVDDVMPNCAEILAYHNIRVTTKVNITKEELLKDIHNYDALIVRSGARVTRAVLEAGTRLKVVGRAGAGVDKIDIAAAREKGIIVINAPCGTAMSVCELTCGLIMALARNIVQAGGALKAGRWEREKYTGTELMGKTIAIIGLGKIGREVAIRMYAFGMKLIAYDPYVSKEECALFNAIKVEFDDIWPLADFITLHAPLVESTKRFINADVLARCNKGVKIINVGRAGLINEDALFDALMSGQVGGVALDVFVLEPPTDPLTLEIINHPAVIATPHLDASTKEGQIRVAYEIAEQLINLMRPGTFATEISRIA